MPQNRLEQPTKSLPRRALLRMGCIAATGWVFPWAGRAASGFSLPVEAGNRRFAVYYEGEKIGSHSILYVSETGETRVSTEIHMLLKVAFFTLFKFNHQSIETWREGRLQSLRSETLENGEALQVEGKATPEGFLVVSKGGPYIAASATLTSNSLWNSTLLQQETVVDAHHGGIIGISARKIGPAQMVIAGMPVRTTLYRFITPFLSGSIWYDDEDLWVHGEFERDGSKILYQLEA